MICLKNRTFAVSQTTEELINRAHRELWFAWKIVLLQYRKQRRAREHLQELCCDLLEKSYFCSIANNLMLIGSSNFQVVICLKNRTFAVSQTTMDLPDLSAIMLWFAWKIVLLQYRKQLAYSYSSVTLSCDLLEKSYFCSIANNL